ncbi:hypothetical protein A3F02_01085 [Candidatus Curtissbacteria bacterium RIFCSPHIGHO2_12_FULL_38_9b]|uniref:Uncharacterized protein n=1 Tax=Candidatus Curtissbacteria bacterium RIFCSPHIGHO2_12_FULL_38_9b TaxID=1797720 RepID=A0A1F5GX64_9BACT|nr:MAG: hypothetical protein A3F02_01085 [Candidatus Curtissbacteria bacterium RIFCSPHIGHO2_12_FULL_38_9b]
MLKHIISARQFDSKEINQIFFFTDNIKANRFNKAFLQKKIWQRFFMSLRQGQNCHLNLQ